MSESTQNRPYDWNLSCKIASFYAAFVKFYDFVDKVANYVSTKNGKHLSINTQARN